MEFVLGQLYQETNRNWKQMLGLANALREMGI